jgi:DNA-binding transcriptional MerR regulator
MSKMSNTAETTIGHSALSELTGLSARQLRRRVDQGIIPPPQGGLYPRDKTLMGLLRHLKSRVETGGGTHLAEKIKLTAARRQKVEVELQALKSQFLPKGQVATVLLNMAINQRRALMGALTTDFPNQLKELDPITLRLLMQTKVDEVCDMMQANARKHCDTPPPEQ